MERKKPCSSHKDGVPRKIPCLVCWDAWKGAALPPAETFRGFLITAFTALPRSRLKPRYTCEKIRTSGKPQCPPKSPAGSRFISMSCAICWPKGELQAEHVQPRIGLPVQRGGWRQGAFPGD